MEGLIKYVKTKESNKLFLCWIWKFIKKKPIKFKKKLLWRLNIPNFKHPSWGCSLTSCTFENYRDCQLLDTTPYTSKSADTHTHSLSYTCTSPTEFLPCRAVYRWIQTALCGGTKRKKMLITFVLLGSSWSDRKTWITFLLVWWLVWLTYRFLWVKGDFIDRASVARQLVEDPARCGVPDIHKPTNTGEGNS